MSPFHKFQINNYVSPLHAGPRGWLELTHWERKALFVGTEAGSFKVAVNAECGYTGRQVCGFRLLLPRPSWTGAELGLHLHVNNTASLPLPKLYFTHLQSVRFNATRIKAAH